MSKEKVTIKELSNLIDGIEPEMKLDFYTNSKPMLFHEVVSQLRELKARSGGSEKFIESEGYIMYATEQGILNTQWNAAEMACQVEEARMQPSVLYKPKISLDGDMWCALYGSNLQEGVCGFGDSPNEAVKAFNLAWITPLPKTGGQTR